MKKAWATPMLFSYPGIGNDARFTVSFASR